MKFRIFNAFIILFSLLIAIFFLWRNYIMLTIEQSSYVCTIYTPEEYQRIMADKKFELIEIAPENKITLEIQLEFPFSVPKNSLLLLRSLSSPVLDGFQDVYFDYIPASGKIQVDIPAPPEYPEGYIWNFYLYVPAKSAICHWGLEETMVFMTEDFPRSWRIKFLPYYIEEDTGGYRTTLFEPL